MPKVGYEFHGFLQVSSARARDAAMGVHMYVKDADRIVVRELERLADGGRSHHRSDAGITKIVTVFHGHEGMGKDDERTGLQFSHPAKHEADPLGGKWVCSSQIVSNLVEGGSFDLEQDNHRSARRCSARICAGLRSELTLFQDHVNQVLSRIRCVVQLLPRP